MEDAEAAGATVYHAGTKKTDAGYVTAGGRVLGVTALGNTLADAVHSAYAAAEKIHFEGDAKSIRIARHLTHTVLPNVSL